MQYKKIGVIGIWHLGEVYSACLAEKGHTVIGISDDTAVVENLARNIPPLAESKLAELIEKNQDEGRLSYTTDFTAVKDCDIVWLTFDIPVNEKDIPDPSVVTAAVKKIIPHLKQDVIIAVSSQIPVGTSAEIVRIIKKRRPELSFGYFYSPENLRLGDAVRCFMEPGRIVVGADSLHTLEVAKEIFASLNAEIVAMSPASAEMSKHAMNAWLATSISFTNDLADVCAKNGADVEDVIRALKSEPRVGQKAYLFAGLGFSGGTLARDLQSLLMTAKKNKIDLPVIEGVLRKNAKRHEVVVDSLKKITGSLKGKTVALFGVTYKSGTSTLRRSQPLMIEKILKKSGARVRLYDPMADKEEVSKVSKSPLFDDPYEAAKGADAVAIVVPDFALRELDLRRLAGMMHKARLLDAQNVLIPKESDIRAAGFIYSSIGR